MTISKDPLGQDALIAEASRWLAALDAGTARVEDFEVWRQSSPAHAVAYARILANWEGVASASALHVGGDLRPTPRASRRSWLKAAAIGVPVLAMGSGFLAQRAYAWDTASTSVGETRRVPLPDGSVAYLNTDSAFSWRYAGGQRILRLDRGEVALDLRRGTNAELRARGTSLPLGPGLFDARMDARQTELTMVDGSAMSLVGAGQGLTLRPNVSVIVSEAAQPRLQARSVEQVASLMAWRSGEIIFLDQSVAEAAAEFNRHLTRKITVGNAMLAGEKIGGRFDLDRPDQFLKAVSLTLNARVETTADGYELTR